MHTLLKGTDCFPGKRLRLGKNFTRVAQPLGLAKESDPGADCSAVAAWVLWGADSEPEYPLREFVRVCSGVRLCGMEAWEEGEVMPHSLC